MSSQTSLQHQRIVDNPPVVPNLSRFGKSRVGRKLARKTLDAFYVASRRYQGSPAKSGPPIPNSEKWGRRQFYTLEQERLGGRRSGATRRRQAQPRWRQVMNLRRRGFSIREIARTVGYSAGWICKLIRRLLSGQPRLLPEHGNHTPQQQQPQQSTRPATTRALSMMVLYAHRLVCLLDDSPTKKAGKHYEELLYKWPKGSYKARLNKYISRMHHSQSPEAATVALAEAFDYAEGLSEMPIDAATRMLNSAFGWQN